jgi:hypothetical protein
MQIIRSPSLLLLIESSSMKRKRKEGRMDGRTDGWTDGRMNGQRMWPPRFKLVHHEQTNDPEGTHNGGMHAHSSNHGLIAVVVVVSWQMCFCGWLGTHSGGLSFIPSFLLSSSLVANKKSKCMSDWVGKIDPNFDNRRRRKTPPPPPPNFDERRQTNQEKRSQGRKKNPITSSQVRVHFGGGEGVYDDVRNECSKSWNFFFFFYYYYYYYLLYCLYTYYLNNYVSYNLWHFFVGRKCPILNHLPGVSGKCGICIERKRGREGEERAGGEGGALLVSKIHMYKEAPFPLPCKLLKICIFLVVQESFGVFHSSQIFILFWERER